MARTNDDMLMEDELAAMFGDEPDNTSIIDRTSKAPLDVEHQMRGMMGGTIPAIFLDSSL